MTAKPYSYSNMAGTVHTERLSAIQADVNANCKNLTEHFRATGLVGESWSDLLRDFADEREEALYGQLAHAQDVARRLAAL